MKYDFLKIYAMEKIGILRIAVMHVQKRYGNCLIYFTIILKIKILFHKQSLI